MIVSVSLGLPAYRAGQIKMLGVGAPRRMPLVSEVPTISESGLPGYQATAWFGLFAPAGTPDEVVLKINKEVTRIFSDPGFRQRFLDPQMFESMTGPADEFAAFVKAERAKWAKLIAQVGIKTE
jgi:tripartite-type tricarboxylate transporter receptor subunit TctC